MDNLFASWETVLYILLPETDGESASRGPQYASGSEEMIASTARAFQENSY